MYDSRLKNEQNDLLVKALLSLKDEDECYRLMEDLLTMREIKDLAQARVVVANSFEMKHYEPCTEREAWDEAYARFCKLQ